ncbi:uncharacterized protein V1510DRAFT_423185 [Dipodascopsis tothii]|uniref:uncharacterized protein n=1 Tax=Dipodascopsis tothii TaxID=44089 RepID=UPI0034CE3BEF
MDFLIASVRRGSRARLACRRPWTLAESSGSPPVAGRALARLQSTTPADPAAQAAVEVLSPTSAAPGLIHDLGSPAEQRRRLLEIRERMRQRASGSMMADPESTVTLESERRRPEQLAELKRISTVGLGDLVEYVDGKGGDNQRGLGVVVKNPDVHTLDGLLVLTPDSRLLSVWPRAVQFVRPRLVDPDLIEDLVTTVAPGQAVGDDLSSVRLELADDGLPSFTVPFARTHTVTIPLRVFAGRANRYLTETKALVTRVHRAICQPDRHVALTLEQIVQTMRSKLRFRQQVSWEYLYALHNALSTDTLRWARNPRQPRPAVEYEFIAYSQEDIEQTLAGTELLKRIGPDHATVRRFRTAIDAFRQSAASGQPVPTELRDRAFSSDERAVISLVQKYVFNLRGVHTSPVTAIVPPFLRTLDRYDNSLVTTDAGMQFLVDVGVYTPWQDTALIDPLRQLKFTEQTPADAPAGPDRMQSVRADMTGLTVFAIDGAGAEEIDDGVAVEYIDADTCWIHVQIANPTALVGPDDTLVAYASEYATTSYYPQCTFPILPAGFTRQVASIVGDGPRRAMAFSAKVRRDGTGDILDYTVRSSTIARVKQLTYADADRVMGWRLPRAELHPVEYAHATADAAEPAADLAAAAALGLTPADVDQLATLHRVFRGQFARRAADQAISFNRLNYSLAVTPSTYVPAPAQIVRALYQPPADRPTVTLAPQDELSRLVVAEMMILAGRIGGLFCTEHGLNVPYRGVDVDLRQADNRRLFEDNIGQRTPLGLLTPPASARLLPLLRAATVGPQRGPHRSLGVDAYVRVTSPLRRYSDMVAMWQIEAALRGEQPVLDAARMTAACAGIAERERQARNASRISTSFWTLWALRERLTRGERPTFTCVVTSPRTHPALTRAMCYELGIDVELALARGDNVRAGDVVVCGGVQRLSLAERACVLER